VDSNGLFAYLGIFLVLTTINYIIWKDINKHYKEKTINTLTNLTCYLIMPFTSTGIITRGIESINYKQALIAGIIIIGFLYTIIRNVMLIAIQEENETTK